MLATFTLLILRHGVVTYAPTGNKPLAHSTLKITEHLRTCSQLVKTFIRPSTVNPVIAHVHRIKPIGCAGLMKRYKRISDIPMPTWFGVLVDECNMRIAMIE